MNVGHPDIIGTAIFLDESSCKELSRCGGRTELDSGTSVAPTRYGAVTPFGEITFAAGLLIGFALGYGVRAFISFRRRQAARRRRAF